MTISYQLDVSRSTTLGIFKLLFRWKGSLWKNIFKELIAWIIAYYFIAFCYRSPYIMSKAGKEKFTNVARYLDSNLSLIPLTFILGFYVSTIVQRWTVVFENMGYIERQALFVSSYVRGNDEETRLVRRAIVRYLCLAQLLVYRDISIKVRKRFPTHESIVKAGFMLEHEREKLEAIILEYDKYWVPINWAYNLIFDARRAAKITSDVMTNRVCDELDVFRVNLQTLCNYDWVPLPLVYPQVIMIAVYFYFSACLVARQFTVDHTTASNTVFFLDSYFPIMTIIQFIFYVGWMKAAEVLLNPMGNDDDDFEGNYLIDKNLATSLCIVDDACDDVPDLKADQFLSTGHVDQIYSMCTIEDEVHPLVGSAVNARVEERRGTVFDRTERLKSLQRLFQRKSTASDHLSP